MGILLAGSAPSPPPPIPTDPGTGLPGDPGPGGVTPPRSDVWPGITGMWWVDARGVEWDLLSDAAPVHLLKGAQGLGPAGFERWESTAPGVHGSRYRGGRRPARDVFWTVALTSDVGSADWQATHDKLMRGLSVDTPGQWIVHTQSGARRLPLLYTGGDDTFTRDPLRRGRHVLGLRLRADDPDWLGSPVSKPFRLGGARRAFLPAAGQTGYFLTSRFTAGAATVNNPGHYPAYPTWTLIGPLTAGTQVGVGGLTTTITTAIPDGETVTIVTHPARLAIRHSSGASWLNGAHVTGSVAFPPIPAGSDVQLTVTMAGTGTVTASFDPRYPTGV